MTIGSGVMQIEDAAFLDCHSLRSVIIPDSVVSIGRYAFSECTGLERIEFGSSISEVGYESFFDISMFDTDGTTYVGTDADNLRGSIFAGENGNLVKKEIFWITFAASGEEVSKAPYIEGDTYDSIVKPQVPARDGYIGEWEDCDLSTLGDKTVNAVYRQTVESSDGSKVISVTAGDGGSIDFSSGYLEGIRSEAEADSGVSMNVDLGGGISVTFDNTALLSLADGTAALTVSEAPLSDSLRNIIGNSGIAYDISFGSNTAFGNGTVTVTLPYTPAEGTDPDDLYVAYIADGRIAETFECAYADGTITFATGHFSTYAIISDSDEGVSSTVAIAAVVLAIAVFAIVASFVLVRNRPS